MRKKIFYPFAVFGLVFLLHAIFNVSKRRQICSPQEQLEAKSPLSLYLEQQDFFLGFSYALAGAFTTYAAMKFLQDHGSGVAGVAGGVTLTGLVYVAACFFSGCCGSPMLAVYLGLFGSSFWGFTKAIIAIVTTISVVIGYFWLERKRKSCCEEAEKG